MYDSLVPQPPERPQHLLGRAVAFCGRAVDAVMDRIGDWVAPKPFYDQLKDGEVPAEDLQHKPMQGDE